MPRPIALALMGLLSTPLALAEIEDVGGDKKAARERRDDCLTRLVKTADPDMSVRELRRGCDTLTRPDEANETDANDDQADTGKDQSLLEKRRDIEALNRSNRFLLTPHNRNYILPANYTDQPNRAPFEQAAGEPVNFQHTEVEFQLSMKVLLAQDLFHNNGNLYMGYTNTSFWQAYNTDISRPFRETNHEPELIVSVDNDWELFGFRNVLNQLVLSHQSNGQSGTLSRSWNRVKFNAIFESENLALALTPWYRLPEDADKDDNPDIADYYGHYELKGAYTRNDHILSFMTRRPFSDKGAVELGWSFPVSTTVRGYLKYFDGYGASLIDYDVRTRSIGLGVIFTDLF